MKMVRRVEWISHDNLKSLLQGYACGKPQFRYGSQIEISWDKIAFSGMLLKLER